MSVMPYEFDPLRFPSDMHEYFEYKFPTSLWALSEYTFDSDVNSFLWQLECPFLKTESGKQKAEN